MEGTLTKVDNSYAWTHSLVTPSTGPLHLAPGVTYPDQSLYIATEVYLNKSGEKAS